MNLLKTVALLWIALLCPKLWGQLNCTFDADQQEERDKDSMYYWKYHEHANYINWFRQHYDLSQNFIPGSSTATITPGCHNTIFVIPVVFHVMYNPSVPATNVPDSLLLKQLEILNDVYANARGSVHPFKANTDIQFCLAQKKPDGSSFSGINRVSYSGSQVKPGGYQKNDLATAAYYDREHYLNIWIVEDIKDSTGASLSVGGYSNINYQPGIDGVVIRYNFVGDYTDCNSCFHPSSRGTALAHEIGHYLGLYHTFQGGCSAGVNSVTCSMQGDLCCDTRPCNQTPDCPDSSTTPDCPTLPFYGSADDNRQNYMSYADEYCKDNFTKDQAQIMHATLLGKRRELVSATNVNSLGLSCCTTTAWFNATNTFICSSDSVKFTAVAQTGVSYRWQIKKGAMLVKDTTLSNYTYSYFVNQQGLYSVILWVITASDTLQFPRINYIEYADCGNKLASTQGNWYFGKYAGLNFSSAGAIKDLSAFKGNPVPTVNTAEGCISQSDNNGDLLFYAGGDSANFPYFRIYDNLHTQVNTFTPLRGHQSSTQGGIVIPFENDTNRYYLVVTGGAGQTGTEPDSKGARYSIIDKTNSNLVTSTRNRPIPYPPGGSFIDYIDSAVNCDEFITAIPKCGGDYWLILKHTNDTSAYSDKLLIYSVTDGGITYYGHSDSTVNLQYYGQLKASPDGSFLAAPGIIFRFNNKTGVASYFKRFQVSVNSTDYYGCSFSPNSQVLYVTESNIVTGTSSILQFDLTSSNDSLSKKTIAVPQTFSYLTSLQLGPDAKIYITNLGTPQLGIISTPDAVNGYTSNNCNFSMEGPSLQNSDGEGGVSQLGLPNMVDAHPALGATTKFYFHIDSGCRTISFYPNNSCDTVFAWYFGDGDSSHLKNPKHTYAANGDYWVAYYINNALISINTIHIGINNPVIAGDSFVTCFDADLNSYSIANLDDKLSYTWTPAGGTVVDVDELFDATITWRDSGILYLKAEDPGTGCKAYDSLTIKRGKTSRTDTLWIADSIPCIESSPFTITGHNYSGWSFEWEWSTDSMNWNNIPAEFDSSIYYTLNADSLVIRRNVYNDDLSCHYFGNPKKFWPQIHILRQPQDVHNCEPNFDYAFGIDISKPSGTTVTYQWQFQYYGTTDWWDGFTIEDFSTSGAGASDSGMLQRCIISTPCGIIYSDTAVLHIHTSTPILTNQPVTDTVTELDTAILTIGISSQSPGSELNWQYSTDNGSSWLNILNATDDTLSFPGIKYCRADTLYRCVVTNACGSITSGSAKIFVLPKDTFDLWMKDGRNDVGNEPNNDSTGFYNDIWNSPDIWVRQSIYSYDTIHQNPDYNPSDSNVVHFRVRNRGIDTSSKGELHLYWIKSGLGEPWPRRWISSATNTRQNLCKDSNYLATYPLGGEINTTPIPIPPIPPGGVWQSYVKWRSPNPFWYCRVVGRNHYYHEDSIDVCLLARVLTCDIDSFGLARREDSVIRHNVTWNNNIATKNFKVTNFNHFYKTSSINWSFVENTPGATGCFQLKLDAVDPTYYLKGNVYVFLDDDLLDGWRNGGLSGSGYTMNDSNTLRVIPNNTLVLSNVCIADTTLASIGVQFKLDSLSTWLSPASYGFRLRQYQTDVSLADGGVDYQVNLLYTPDLGGPGEYNIIEDGKDEEYSDEHPINGMSVNPEKSTNSNQSAIVDNFKVYPNPFTSTLNIEFFMRKEGRVTAKLVDMLGRTVAVISENENYSKGKQIMVLDSRNIIAGMYFLKFSSPTENKVVKVELLNE